MIHWCMCQNASENIELFQGGPNGNTYSVMNSQLDIKFLGNYEALLQFQYSFVEG